MGSNDFLIASPVVTLWKSFDANDMDSEFTGIHASKRCPEIDFSSVILFSRKAT